MKSRVRPKWGLEWARVWDGNKEVGLADRQLTAAPQVYLPSSGFEEKGKAMMG